MGFWQAIWGTKTYCVVCGGPIRESKARLESGPYCSEACMAMLERLSAPPRSASDVASTEHVSASKPRNND
jgi:hypothetical protein